jgi:hypothetical protein
MKNEILFIGHIFLVVGFVLGALRLGKGALIVLVSLQAVLANLFVVKQMGLVGFSVTCSDVFAVGAILGLNLLQEYYGRDEANRAVRISFFSLVFFVIMSQIHLFYAPISADQTHGAFSSILSPTPRIAIASIAVFYLVQKFDVRLFGWMRDLARGKFLPLRVGASLVLTQALDTVLFSFLGLYGIVAEIFDVVLISFLVKCLIIGCSSPITAFSKRFAKDVSI